MAHTPGPWQFIPTAAGEHQLLCGQNAGEGILLVKQPARSRVNPADKALIRAAPDLLSALKDLAIAADTAELLLRKEYEAEASSLAAKVTAARAAIARAEQP